MRSTSARPFELPLLLARCSLTPWTVLEAGEGTGISSCQAVTILGARASTDRSDCAVAVAFDASSARATVQCSAAGFVSVYVTVLTDRGPKEERHVLEFRDPPTNDDTLCNDSADAGPSDDASD